MTLPITITGIALDIATVGPYQSSAGNYYFFGKDASTSTTLQCYKATDPTDSWASIATNTGFGSAGILDIAGFSQGDTIHLAVADRTLGASNYKYRTFNMATEAFDIAETIVASLSLASNLCSIVARSDGSPIVLFDAESNGISYSRRTGTDTWITPVQVDDGGGSQYNYPVAILGGSDKVHFMFWSTTNCFQKTLNASNELQAATTGDAFYFSEGISFDFGGATRCVAAGRGFPEIVYFDSGDSPALNFVSISGAVANTMRVLENGGIIYLLYSKISGSNKDYYFRSSDDGGAHWSVETFICSATNSGAPANTSRFNRIYSAAAEVIVPFLYADDSGTTLKHNHKVVRSTLLQGLATFVGGSFFTSSAAGGDFTAPLEDPFRLRFSIVNEGDTLDAVAWQLYVSKNGGAYHAVTTTSDDAYSLNAGASPDETQIFIPRLTAP